MKEMKSTRRKLEAFEDSGLKTSGSEEANVIRSASSEAVHQKLTSFEVLKIIRSWKTEELQMLFK